jgi:hypothetical protein
VREEFLIEVSAVAAVCEGLSSEEILISKGIPAAVSLLVGTAPAKASSR